MALQIYNSLTRRVETFQPLNPGRVGLYVCGMTVYDLCHIGHARMMLSFDVVARWLRASGYALTYVRNITDIDDKIIRRAQERGISIRQLTEEMVSAMHADMAQLRILPPDYEPRATDYIPQMLGIISRLEDKGLAYRADNGDVNYSVRKFAGYGKLSGKSLDDLRAGNRVAVDSDKQDPLDFVLWKAAKETEPEDAKYPSAYGTGRPGWHIECSAMSCALLGEHFDIHGGGADLQFPHHENEIAQSEGASGGTFVNYWMHNGFLNIDNEKMSKSLGNFLTIRDVLSHHDGESLRLLILRTHYRSPFNYSDALLEEARQALRRLYSALNQFKPEALAGEFHEDASHPLVARFRAEMDEDFNTPGALAVLFELATQVNRQPDVASARLLKHLAGHLGLLQQVPETFLQAGAGLSEAAIQARIEERQAAKAAKDFASADRVRKELQEAGVLLKDSPQGTTWMRA